MTLRVSFNKHVKATAAVLLVFFLGAVIPAVSERRWKIKSEPTSLLKSGNLEIIKARTKYTHTHTQKNSLQGYGGINSPYCCGLLIAVGPYLAASSEIVITLVYIHGMERKERWIASVWMYSLKCIIDWSYKACFCLPGWSAGSEGRRCLQLFAEISFCCFCRADVWESSEEKHYP